jgi:hypothetical protein
MSRRTQLRAGDWVEVLGREEVLRTLDERGQLESLPFMPEMFQYCGRRLQVVKRAHKTCDPPSGLQARRMANAVHLSAVRCGGESHGGCQAGCLIFWKEAWLKKVDGPSAPLNVTIGRPDDVRNVVWVGVYAASSGPDAPEPIYVCQSTNVYAATTPLPWWDVRQYAEDLSSGNVRVPQMLAAALFFVYHSLVHSGVGFGSALSWTYDAFQRLRGGTQYPWRFGRVAKGARTPAAKLDLHPGELVKVKRYEEILETLDQDWKNRGMYFDGELVPFCGGTYDVLHRVEKIIDEKSGRMVRLKNDAIILKDVACEARYAKCRRFCSRAIYPYWREIWLERTS